MNSINVKSQSNEFHLQNYLQTLREVCYAHINELFSLVHEMVIACDHG